MKIHGMLGGLAALLFFFAVTGPATILVLKRLKAPLEIRRKALHMLCVLSLLGLLEFVESWHAAASSALAFAALVYPALLLLRRFPRLSALLAERREGEFKSSLIAVYAMFAALSTVFWGWLGDGGRCVIAAALLAWGLGDAAAALVGKALGRRMIEHRFVEGKKTVEGSCAMLAFSFIGIFAAMAAGSAQPWYICLAIAAVVAPICAIVELFSMRGMDTITVPLFAAASTYGAVALVMALGI